MNPTAAGTEAVTKYDANGDGALDAAELEKCPGILVNLAKYDTDNNAKVSAAEITARVKSWFEHGTGLTSHSCQVMLDGQPLVGAQVVFEPEPFLGPAIKPCAGKTEQGGNVILAIAPNDLPPEAKDIRGATAQPGLYKVRITHPDFPLPARFNTETTLGQEINPAARQEEGTQVFALSSQ